MNKLLLTTCILLGFALQAQNIITTIAGNGTAGYSGDGGQATAAEFNAIGGIAFDATGNLFVCDASNNVIRKINTAGIINTIAGTGTAGYSGDGGQASLAELNLPYDMVIDHSGNIYITDYNNSRVRKITTAGIISTIAGNGTFGYNGDGGPATAAELHWPEGLALDATGNLYISDEQNNVIRKVNTAAIISTIAGNGTLGYSGDGATATNAELQSPAGLCFDNIGNLYIADVGNNVIRKVNTAGIISTYAGNGIGTYSGNGGQATAASLDEPQSVVCDSGGNLYLSDNLNFVIRKVNSLGIITTIVGNSTQGYSGDGGAATNCELNYAGYGVFDATGNLYIIDEGNNVIRKITDVATMGINQVSGIRYQFILIRLPE